MATTSSMSSHRLRWGQWWSSNMQRQWRQLQQQQQQRKRRQQQQRRIQMPNLGVLSLLLWFPIPLASHALPSVLCTGTFRRAAMHAPHPPCRGPCSVLACRRQWEALLAEAAACGTDPAVQLQLAARIEQQMAEVAEGALAAACFLLKGLLSPAAASSC